MFDDLYTKGFVVLDGTKYTQQIDVDKIEWAWEENARHGDLIYNGNHPAKDKEFYRAALLSLHAQIGIDCLDPYYEYTLGERRIWEGVINDAKSWHNDTVLGPNCFFLLYFNDSAKHNTGSISFTNREETWKIYPTVGTMVAVNNDNRFLHLVEPADHKRVAAGFFFNLDHGSYNKTN